MYSERIFSSQIFGALMDYYTYKLEPLLQRNPIVYPQDPSQQ
jgi:hypothetical protein